MRHQTQSEKAEAFRLMHRAPKTLALPNAWDVASARIFEDTGFPAIATTSAGVANSLGYRDGEQISRDEMLGVVRRVAAAVSVPVTADLEAGYAKDPEGLAETARALIDAGGIGLNLEDATGDPADPLFTLEQHVARIKAIREAGAAAGVALVINARTDRYWKGPGDEKQRLEGAIVRGNAYLQAGADCIFIPGAIKRETIEALCRGISGPINILAIKGVPPIAELEGMGVARVSVGSGIMRAAMGLTRRAAQEFFNTGTYESFVEGAFNYDDLNSLFGRARTAGR
jgi:2-methylisocitrate lyase-like PEP mutase family enzyme